MRTFSLLCKNRQRHDFNEKNSLTSSTSFSFARGFHVARDCAHS